MITTEVLYRAQDYPWQVFTANADGVAVDINDLNSARFFILINKVEVEKYSMDVEAGFELAGTGVADNELIVPMEGARMANWPKGLMEMRCEVEFNDTLYPGSGRMEVEVFQLGVLE